MSDTRRLEDDRSGDTLVQRLESAGHRLAARTIVPDEVAEIRGTVEGWVRDPRIDVVITTGGTGFTGRDVTPEAVEPLFNKRMDGFSAIFHRISYDKIGTSTLQSRATAGLAGGTFVFCLPGSPGACRDGWDGVLEAQLDYRHRPCNFVEIMPRLDEHLRRLRASTPAREAGRRSSPQLSGNGPARQDFYPRGPGFSSHPVSPVARPKA